MSEATAATAPPPPSSPEAPAASEAAATPQPAKGDPSSSAPKKWTLKVDGKDVTVDSEEKLVALAMKGFGSEKRFAEAAKARKEAEERKARLKADPWAILAEEGLDPDALAEARLAERLKKSMLSPEQQRAAELEKKLAEYEAKEKAAKEEVEKAALTKAEESAMAELDVTLPKVLAAAGLPKTPKSIIRIAEKMRDNLAEGLDLSPEQLAAEVREEYLAEHVELWSAMEGDALLKHIPEAVLKKIRKADLSRLKAAPSVSATPAPKAGASSSSKGAKFQSREDYEAQMEEIRRSR